MDGQKDVDFALREKRNKSGFLLRLLRNARYQQGGPIVVTSLSVIWAVVEEMGTRRDVISDDHVVAGHGCETLGLCRNNECMQKMGTGLFVWCTQRNHARVLKSLSSKAAASEMARRTLRYVEPLSDATCLAQPLRQGGERRWETFSASCSVVFYLKYGARIVAACSAPVGAGGVTGIAIVSTCWSAVSHRPFVKSSLDSSMPLPCWWR